MPYVVLQFLLFFFSTRNNLFFVWGRPRPSVFMAASPGATRNFQILDLPSSPFDDNRFFSKSLLMSNVTYINTISVFCSGIICALGKDNQYYSDSHHLNVAGSERLKAGFKATPL